MGFFFNTCDSCEYKGKCVFASSFKSSVKLPPKNQNSKIDVLLINLEEIKTCLTIDEKPYLVSAKSPSSVISLKYDDFTILLHFLNMEKLELPFEEGFDSLFRQIVGGNFYLILLGFDPNSLMVNVFVALNLLEMGQNVAIIVKAQERDISPVKNVSRLLNLPVFNMVKCQRKKLLKTIVEKVRKPTRNIYVIEYPKPVEIAVEKMLMDLLDVNLNASRRWLALKILEQNSWVWEKIRGFVDGNTVEKWRRYIANMWDETGVNPRHLICETRFKYVKEILEKCGNGL
ncbi:MAG: hypothetical protein ACP6IP_02275 [Candidatus Njordarchaeia archaeon]